MGAVQAALTLLLAAQSWRTLQRQPPLLAGTLPPLEPLVLLQTWATVALFRAAAAAGVFFAAELEIIFLTLVLAGNRSALAAAQQKLCEPAYGEGVPALLRLVEPALQRLAAAAHPFLVQAIEALACPGVAPYLPPAEAARLAAAVTKSGEAARAELRRRTKDALLAGMPPPAKNVKATAASTAVAAAPTQSRSLIADVRAFVRRSLGGGSGGGVATAVPAQPPPPPAATAVVPPPGGEAPPAAASTAFTAPTPSLPPPARLVQLPEEGEHGEAEGEDEEVDDPGVPATAHARAAGGGGAGDSDDSELAELVGVEDEGSSRRRGGRSGGSGRAFGSDGLRRRQHAPDELEALKEEATI